MRALLVSVLVTGVLGTAFVLSAPPSVRTPLAWCTAAGALLLCVAAVTVTRYVQVAGRCASGSARSARRWPGATRNGSA